MGLKRLREDSIAELRKQKTIKELQAENEQLKTEVNSLNTQLTDTQIALCDVYELLVGVRCNG